MLPIIQIIISIAVIVLVLLQERSSGAGGVFGGSGGEFYQTRRGFEKGLFAVTIILIALYAGTAFLHLVLPLP